MTMFQRVTRGVLILRAVVEHVLFFVRILPFTLRMIWHYYLSVPQSFHRGIAYGSNHHCTLDVHPPSNRDSKLKPVIFFLYGGAWGSGDKAYYGLLGKVLSHEDIVAVVPNYVLHPRGYVEDMLQDVSRALLWTVQNIYLYGGDKDRIFIMGHSAGAHLGAQFIIKNALFHGAQDMKEEGQDEDPYRHLSDDFTLHQGIKIAGFIGISGVYDISDHYLHESKRAVENLSPMRPAMRGIHNFKHHSPTQLLPALKKRGGMPKFYLMHDHEDKTVPIDSSSKFAQTLDELGESVVNIKYKGMGHAELILSLMLQKDRNHKVLLRDILKIVQGDM